MKAFCVLFCVCLLFVQSVLCQFGFFPQRDERAFTPIQIGQGLLPAAKRFRDRLSGFLNLRPEYNRPGVINDQPNNPNNLYTNQNQFNNNNGQSDDRPVVFPSQNGQDSPEFVQPNQPPTNLPNQLNYPGNEQYQNNQNNNDSPVAFPTPVTVETNPAQNYQPNNEFQTNQNNPENNFNQNGNVIFDPAQGQPSQNSNTYPADQNNSGFDKGQTEYQPTQINQVENANGYTPGQDNFNQGENNFNQGQNNVNQGQNNINQGQTGQENSDRSDFVNFGPTELPKTSESIQHSDGNIGGQETAETTLAPLTPAVILESRNFESMNFNFGPSGIFAETCQTVENEIGSCITVTHCEPYYDLLKKSKTDPAIVNLLRRAHCGFEGNNPKVCCPRPGFPTASPQPQTTIPTTTTSTTTPSPTTTTTTPTPTTTTTPVTIPEPSGKNVPEVNVQADYVPAFLEPPVCGVSNASFSRVVGGVDAKLGDFPWMALLGYKGRRNVNTRWLCGGSLISSRHVLTAAHCIHGHEDELYVIRLGELDLEREDEGATPLDVLVKTKIKHEEYSPIAYTNDIGVLVLDKEVEFTDLIRPICIPKDTELRARSYENYNPLIAGWGDTEFRGPSANHLQVLQLPVVSNDFCKQAYIKFKNQTIDERVLCAGYKKGGKDACQGDSGGPLMQPIYNQKKYTTHFYQIGVVSFGKKCAEAGFPGVYSRVTHFVPWIQSKVIGN